ncbi:MAG: aminotransferase class I/II-fold pyridoxal phosphate-dependent enzyme [Firmicutes bacterium]|nr:aminotransferase class I/II-fold pyridoxal phosphate-dependent enzyme [Bacillota bacterium]
MIDLRSDTVTRPTADMRMAMANAEVGDDVYQEDLTVHKLEETAAQMLGKEAALLVTSGTQGNQVAVLAQVRAGDEVIAEADAHIFYYEVGAIAALAGAQTRTIAGVRGQMSLAAIGAAIRGENIHYPRTALICLENTHNRAGGAILPVAYMQSVHELAHAHGVPVHLDGARLFHAAVATGTPIADFAAAADTVQICLSKGLGAPIGSLLLGTRELIERARKWRKMLGGGMRQAGVIAAPGLIALTQMVDRLAQDHEKARRLAAGLAEIRGLTLDPALVETNIVIADVSGLALSPAAFLARLAECGVLATEFGAGTVRFVTHFDVSDADVDKTLSAVQAAASA